jgi:Ca-activated chloride channel family protein
MTGFAFADKRFLVVAAGLVLVLAVAYALELQRRRHLLDRLGHAPQLARMVASMSSVRRGIKTVLIVLAVGLVALALARPQTEGEKLWKQRGIDVALVIDFSKSMLAADVYPSRIELAKIDADHMLDKFFGDRVALVAFGGEAIHYPLTTDHEAAKKLYDRLDPRDMVPGTDIGEALRTARCLLRYDVADADCAYMRNEHGGPALGAEPKPKAEAIDRGRAIVVFTDGEDTEGHAKAEVERAAQLGIDIFFIGVGTKAGARIPDYGPKGELLGWKKAPDGNSYYTTRLDESALKELAVAAGGEDHYLYANPRGFNVEGIVKALSRLKEGNLEERTESVPSEAYHWFLFPAFLALVIEACMSDRRRLKKEEIRA